MSQEDMSQWNYRGLAGTSPWWTFIYKDTHFWCMLDSNTHIWVAGKIKDWKGPVTDCGSHVTVTTSMLKHSYTDLEWLDNLLNRLDRYT
jgi:hypothetical protein